MMTLTEREKLVLIRRAEGACVKEIAFDLKVHEKTVEYYFQRARTKIGIQPIPLCIQFALKYLGAQWKV